MLSSGRSTSAQRDNYGPLAALFLSWGTYFVLFWPQLFYLSEAGDLIAGWRIIWADWALHLTQAHAFAFQPFIHVLDNNPIFAGSNIAYPFVTNWLSGMLISAGTALDTAFVTPSIAFSLALLFSLFIFGRVLTHSGWVAVLGISLFFLSGGLEFYYYLGDLAVEFSWEKVLYPPHHYTFLEEHGFYWKSIILSSLIPQRALLLGMPCMLLSLTYITARYQTGFTGTSYRTLFTVGLATGFLAIIHTHSLLVLFLICCCLFISDLKNYRFWLSFAFGVSCTALPWLPFLLGDNTSGFMQFHPGWYGASEGDSPFIDWLWFWFKNWGLFFPLCLITLVLLFIRGGQFLGFGSGSDGKQQPLFLAFSLLFVLANVFQFQPYLWDNTKILLWAHLGLSFLVAQLVARIFNKGYPAKVIASTMVMLMVFSGLIDLVKSLHVERESHTMVSSGQIELARQLRDLSDPTDIILTPDYHLHFITTISGRGVLMGYRGWLWSYNIDYAERERDIKAIYSGATNTNALLQKYAIEYIVVDELAVRDFSANRAYFESNFATVLSNREATIYRVDD
ncbi:MAG: hypothetical protein HOC23_18440 [Halieaceae bacterium]|jgi:hypothetical protein|nr:hypothetical protein [Halieaceae bacterium]